MSETMGRPMPSASRMAMASAPRSSAFGSAAMAPQQPMMRRAMAFVECEEAATDLMCDYGNDESGFG